MNRELLGRRGHLVLVSRDTFGWPLKVPVTVIGFGRGRVKVRILCADGNHVERLVEESHLSVRTHWGRKSRTVHCKYEGCPATYVNPFKLETHEAEEHTRCTCGRYFTAKGLPKHLGQYKRRSIEHP